jgi:hypothetical protein
MHLHRPRPAPAARSPRRTVPFPAPKSRLSAVVACLVLGLVSAGCSSGDSGAQPSPHADSSATPTTPAPGCPAGSPPTLGASGTETEPTGDPAVVAPTLFGLHQARIGSTVPSAVPCAKFGTIRLWDSQTSWAQVEPADDAWDFSILDRAVGNIRSHGAQPLIVLGQTPAWAASEPTQAYYGPGANTMPRSLAEWREYVAQVATRYRGTVSEYEIWNEPNVVGFWAGTPQQMAELARSAYEVIKGINPTATVTTPGFVVRRPAQQSWFGRYLQTGAARYADVINVHLYPDSTSGPESLIPLMDYPRKMMAALNITLPLWNTELNYGLATNAVAAKTLDLPDDTAGGYVLRTYLLSKYLGVNRSYWYAWDAPLGIVLSTPEGAPTVAGRAYSTSYEWLIGARYDGCTADPSGVWTCVYRKGGRAYHYVWSPGHPTTVTAPSGATRVLRLDGHDGPVPDDGKVEVGEAPVAFVVG